MNVNEDGERAKKIATYILGMKFHIETDHKPLVPLLEMKHLDSLPPRILTFRLRGLVRFSYIITHIPGNLLYRHPIKNHDYILGK